MKVVTCTSENINGWHLLLMDVYETKNPKISDACCIPINYNNGRTKVECWEKNLEYS